MARLTAQEFQEKHARRLKQSVEDIRKGVQRVTENPCELAASKADKMLARLTEAVQSGKWGRKLRAVKLEDWKRKTIDVGINRIGSGIDAAAPKVVAFAEKLLPAIDNARAKIKGMPDLTLEDNINRMVTYAREMAKFKND